jgi:hypothetical protein
MHSLAYHITVASCLPREDMWLPCEQAEQLEIPNHSFLAPNDQLFNNPHDMVGESLQCPIAY